MRKLILASASPRRREILLSKGYEFDIITSDKEVGIDKAVTSPEKFAVGNALLKAQDVYNRTNGEGVVLGADTVVCLNGVIFGKPKNEQDAIEMLKTLSGKTHQVITGYALIAKDMRETGHETTLVTFNELSDETLNAYIKSGLYKGKAGAYGIQDGFDLVKICSGDYDNVVGLPISKIDETVKEFLK